jgi:small subunit ribosomal protein S13
MFKKSSLKNKILTTNFNNRVNFKEFNFLCFSKVYKSLFKSISASKHRRAVKENIYFHTSNKTLKGFKHKNNLPVRGQRTRTNAKTVRGKNNAEKTK